MKQKVGREAIVTKCMHGHRFEIGETILVGSYHPESGDYICYSLQDSSIDWWLRDYEFEFVSND